MKYLRELVITILVAAVLVLWIRSRSAEIAAARILEKEKARLQHQVDSLEELKNIATRETLRAWTEKAKSDASVQELRHRNQNLTAAHERLRKARPVAFSDSSIVHEWSELFRDR